MKRNWVITVVVATSLLMACQTNDKTLRTSCRHAMPQQDSVPIQPPADEALLISSLLP